MLTKLDIPGHGPYVFGCFRTANPCMPLLSAAAPPAAFSDVNALRVAAQSLNPIFKVIGNIYGNDRWGVCAIVAAFKMQAIFDCAAGREFRIPTLADVLRVYRVFNPDFNAQTGAGDNGCELEDVIAFWIKTGLYADGYGKIKAAYRVDASSQADVEAALEKYGPLYVGCDLPSAWPQLARPGFIWPVEGAPDPTLGHATFWYGDNANGVFDSTWALEGTILWPAVRKYFVAPTGEVYAIVPA